MLPTKNVRMIENVDYHSKWYLDDILEYAGYEVFIVTESN